MRPINLAQAIREMKVFRKHCYLVENRYDGTRARMLLLCWHADGVLVRWGGSLYQENQYWEECTVHGYTGCYVEQNAYTVLDELKNPLWAAGCTCGANQATEPTYHMFFCDSETAAKHPVDDSRPEPSWASIV